MSPNPGPRPALTLTETQRNKLVEEYLPLVRYVIGRLPVTLPAVLDKDDLFEVGVIGLMNAASSYDPSKGALFKTFAYANIRGAVLDELRKHDIVPRSRRDRLKAFEKASRALEDEYGRPATPEEIAVEMGLSVEQVDDCLVNMQAITSMSLDDGDNGGAEHAAGRMSSCLAAVNTVDPSDQAELNELKERLSMAILDLPEQERRVVVLYYAEGLLLKEIGAVLGVTESRVSQIHSRAIYRLNVALNSGAART